MPLRPELARTPTTARTRVARACPIPDPWQVTAELDVHPFGGGDVSEDTGEDG